VAIAAAPPRGDSNAHLFAQFRILWARQGHSLNCSTDNFGLTVTEPFVLFPALSDFHELSVRR